MSSTTPQLDLPPGSRRVQDSAKKICHHIRTSGLRPGDQYLSAKEAGRLVGESVMTAQRAMMLLASKNILERRPRAGTFVGAKAVTATPLPCVHVLVPESFAAEQSAHEGFWSHVQGLRAALPQVSVRFDFIPHQDLAYTRQVVEQAAGGGSLMGAVLVLPSRKMRAWFNQSGIPTVVYGGVEADLNNLGWLNWDQKQVGRLLTDWLIARGHKRMATIMRDVWSIGEHMLHDGIAEALSAANLPANAIQVRSAPSEAQAIRELVRTLLAQRPDYPTGFICRSELQADVINEVVEENQLSDKIDIALGNTLSQNDQSKYASITPQIDPVEQGRVVGMMLKGLAEGKQENKIGRNIPVELCLPDR